ncbi:hypothetical protein BV898_04470 [Hypsibius exemplaris]|uniref:Uncharacterized protein n=1 Tax=Hypsibius exemplaris TaxID=2072580 RepID=A0A1W0X273_HYPEX|nr:hypothetical protein BV898_04470 [Hypsibius exemplaris]
MAVQQALNGSCLLLFLIVCLVQMPNATTGVPVSQSHVIHKRDNCQSYCFSLVFTPNVALCNLMCKWPPSGPSARPSSEIRQNPLSHHIGL